MRQFTKEEYQILLEGMEQLLTNWLEQKISEIKQKLNESNTQN